MVSQTRMSAIATALAEWATRLEPSSDDLALAERSLRDTVAVTFAAREEPIVAVLGPMSEAGRWATLAHALDFDDLHLPSTAHISAICVPVALATGGGARAYLAGAGVMARLGTALGWSHYGAGWHATCTAGAPAAAVTAAVARGLDVDRTAVAMALALPGAGGVHRAFGTMAKGLQVGFAVETGLRAAALAEVGATADIQALEDWIALVGGDPGAVSADGPVVPGGLAIKLFPCCYALQRPISAMASLMPLAADRVHHVRVQTPASALAPLIHHRPDTGLEAKFSLEYGIAATLIDGVPDLASFTDASVGRSAARGLFEAVEQVPTAGGDQLLAGDVTIEVTLDDGATRRATLISPPGAPDRPPSEAELMTKIHACAGPADWRIAALSWDTAADFLRSDVLPHGVQATHEGG